MKEQVMDLLAEVCEDDSIRENLDMDLFETEMMDSLAFAELIFGLEDHFGVVISPSEIKREDMNTARKILALVEARAGK